MNYYNTISVLNEAHKIYLVQDAETREIYVKKILEVYNPEVYRCLTGRSISGVPRIKEAYEEDGRLIVIEEYVAGRSLQEKLASDDMDTRLLFQYMCELCDILERLHGQKPAIVHRDIKPSNIMITNQNHVVLIDFNAAKFSEEKALRDTVLLGTKGYAAPEQYGFGASTPQTDIYALGVLLGELAEELSMQSKALERIVRRCTMLEPRKRYVRVREVRAALEAADKGRSDFARFAPPGFRTLTPWKMIVSGFVYAYLLWGCYSDVLKSITLSDMVNRTLCLFMVLAPILFSFNYLDCQRYFPLCGSKNSLLRYIGVALADILLVVLLFAILLAVNFIFSISLPSQ